jgi:hypothetical protein
MKRIAVASLFLLVASSASGQQSWDGTWAGGWTDKSGAQIIFAGDSLIGFYWRDDYVEDAKGDVAKGGATATIKWSRGEAVLTREGPTSARAAVREQGRQPVTFELKKD